MIQLIAAFILVAAGQAEDSCADGSCASSRQLLQQNSESSATVLRGEEEWGDSAAPSSTGSCTTAGNAGVGAGHPCIFPFTYKRNNYSACAVVDHSTPWCSTQVDGNGEFIVAKWGECSSSCLGTTTTTTIITSPSTRVPAGSSQIPVTSAAGIKVGDLITLNKASLFQAQAARSAKKWEWGDIFGLGTSSQKPATYVVQKVILGSDGVGGTVVLDRKLDQAVEQGAKIVVSSPPLTTTTTTALSPDTTTTVNNDDRTTTTTTNGWAIIPVVVNASKTPKFKLKVTFKK